MARAGEGLPFSSWSGTSFSCRPLRLAWWEASSCSALLRTIPERIRMQGPPSALPGLAWSLLCPSASLLDPRHTLPHHSRIQEINRLRRVRLHATEIKAGSVSSLVLPRGCCGQTQETERGAPGNSRALPSHVDPCSHSEHPQFSRLDRICAFLEQHERTFMGYAQAMSRLRWTIPEMPSLSILQPRLCVPRLPSRNTSC